MLNTRGTRHRAKTKKYVTLSSDVSINHKIQNVITLIAIAIIIACLLPYRAFAIEDKSKTPEEDTQNYSEEYKRYLELSDEEKSKLEVIPRKYNVPLDSLYEDTIVVKEDSNLFNLFGLKAKERRVSAYQDELPEKFDLRDKIDIKVENQGNYGLCWDFASIKSLETYLALNGYGDYDFSELHLDYLESEEFGRWAKLHDGRNFSDFVDYLEKGYGPVSEEEVPYDAEYTIDEYDYLLSLKPKVYVNEVVDFPTISKDINTYTDEELELFKDKVKKHLMQNGGIYTVIAPPESIREYFNPYTYAEYYDGDHAQIDVERSWHAVTIIGYDDNYSKENFNKKHRPKNDGAYIALNSWGTEFGDNGIFYISYEDYSVGTSMSGIIFADTDYEKCVEKINFQDKNLYNAIKNELDEKIINFDDEKLQLDLLKLNLSDVKYLYLNESEIENISGLENFKNLKYLGLTKQNISDFSKLSELNNLTNLTISECGLNNIDDIVKLDNLEELNVSGNNLTTVEGISKLNKLKYLYLSNNNLNSLGDILNFDELCYLDISGNKLNNIQGIDKLEKLYYLNISNNNLENLSEIGKLKMISQLVADDDNISNFDFIKNLNNINSISLRNNNITDVSELKNLKEIGVDLSGNKIENGLSALKNLSWLELENCDLDDEDIKEMKDYKVANLNLSNNNKITDLSPLNISNLYYLNLSNNTNLNLEKIPKFKKTGQEDDEYYYGAGLTLQNCNITDTSFLGNMRAAGIDLSNNPINSISENAKDMEVNEIDLSNTDVKDVSNLTNINSLTLDNTSDVTGVENLEKLRNLSMRNTGLTNVDMLKNIKTLDALYLSKNEIENLDGLKNLKSIGYLDLSNNKIKNIDSLSNVNIDWMDLSNNNIASVPEQILDKYGAFGGQTPILEYNIQAKTKNKFKLPNIISWAYANRYKMKTKITTKNCEIDYKNNFLILSSDGKDGTASIEISGKTFDKIVYTINYNVVSDINVVDFEIIKQSDNDLYIEGEDFDDTGFTVCLKYDNGSYDIITDYTIENGKNLAKDQENVTIKYKNYEIQQPIKVYGKDEAIRLTFEDKNLYNFLIDNYRIKQRLISKNYKKREIVIKYDGDIAGLNINKAGITNLKGLNNLTKMTSFGIDELNYINNIEELMKMPDLDHISFWSVKNEDMSCFENMKKLEGFYLYNSKVKNIGKILDLPNLKNLVINNVFEADDLEIKKGKIVLPQVISAIKQKYPNCKIKAQIAYELNTDGTPKGKKENLEIKAETDGTYTVEFDEEISDKKPKQRRLIQITIDNIGVLKDFKTSIYYTPAEEGNTKFNVIKRKGEKYITNISAEGNGYNEVINYNNFPNKSYSLEAYDGSGKILKENDKIPTGTKINC